MKKERLSGVIRVILFVAGILLIFVLFKPIWKIELMAPQYPEGLMMNISARGLGGDIDIINGLNHYIGMKTLHNEDFVEFMILPYIISAFALCFFIVSIAGRKKPMYALFILYVLFGILAMVDFWRWEYNYGHNLDPAAAIIVPGMAYQPPLIGFKQLLNFGAYSVPDIGGWLFLITGALILFCIIVDYRSRKKSKAMAMVAVPVICLFILSISSCADKPEPIKIGSDNCHFCSMTISTNKFGAEVITKKGKVFKFDDVSCMLSGISGGGIDIARVKGIYFPDFCNGSSLLESGDCYFLKSDKLKSPMNGNIAAFSSRDSMESYKKKLGAEEMMLEDIIKLP